MKPLHDGLLDPRTWLDRVGRLLDGLGDTEAAPDRHIRKAYHLVQLAPEPMAAGLPDPIDEDRFEALLEEGSYVPAVSALIGVGYEVYGGEHDAHDRDPSLSMLAAWAASFRQPAALTH